MFLFILQSLKRKCFLGSLTFLNRQQISLLYDFDNKLQLYYLDQILQIQIQVYHMGSAFTCDLCFPHENTFKKHQDLMFQPQLPFKRLEIQKDHQFLTLSSSQNPSPFLQQRKEQKDDNDNPFLSQLHGLRLLQPRNFEIFLSLDERWSRMLQKNPQFSIKIEEVYAQISNIRLPHELWSKKIVKRSAFDNKKIQILFKQQVPMIGKYFFQVDLISYQENKRCDFTIGIVNHEFAKDKLHSRDSLYQQSYTFIEKRLNFTEKESEASLLLNLRFRVEVNREEQQIAFFINDELKIKQKIKQNLQHATLLVPYLQTQYEGVVLSWKTALSRFAMSNQILSTIGEEASSIISF